MAKTQEGSFDELYSQNSFEPVDSAGTFICRLTRIVDHRFNHKGYDDNGHYYEKKKGDGSLTLGPCKDNPVKNRRMQVDFVVLDDPRNPVEQVGRTISISYFLYGLNIKRMLFLIRQTFENASGAAVNRSLIEPEAPPAKLPYDQMAEIYVHSFFLNPEALVKNIFSVTVNQVESRSRVYNGETKESWSYYLYAKKDAPGYDANKEWTEMIRPVNSGDSHKTTDMSDKALNTVNPGDYYFDQLKYINNDLRPASNPIIPNYPVGGFLPVFDGTRVESPGKYYNAGKWITPKITVFPDENGAIQPAQQSGSAQTPASAPAPRQAASGATQGQPASRRPEPGFADPEGDDDLPF